MAIECNAPQKLQEPIEVTNPSGVWPVEYKVLVKPDDIRDTDPVYRRAREAGLDLIETVSDREQMSQVKGALVAVGSNAFEDWGYKPKVGARVMIGKYVGLMVKGDDGREYRLCNDKDIAAVLS